MAEPLNDFQSGFLTGMKESNDVVGEWMLAHLSEKGASTPDSRVAAELSYMLAQYAASKYREFCSEDAGTIKGEGADETTAN